MLDQRIQMANDHMNRYATSYANKELQMNTGDTTTR
jgi:hypothetical protein